MATLAYVRCCGVKELEGISLDRSAKKSIRSALDYWSAMRFGRAARWGDEPRPVASHIFFTQAGDGGVSYGDRLMRVIRKHRLGQVTRSDQAPPNPNTQRPIRFYLWTPDWDRVRDWYQQG